MLSIMISDFHNFQKNCRLANSIVYDYIVGNVFMTIRDNRKQYITGDTDCGDVMCTWPWTAI